ncbi:MAG: type IV secretion system protein [Rickettsiaceae bacterium]|nr:type IV secretion system protein [Rickettsiaceae bacterium]
MSRYKMSFKQQTKLVSKIAYLTFIFSLALYLIMIAVSGASLDNKGVCFMRYGGYLDQPLSNVHSYTKSVKLRADGNYQSTSTTDSSGNSVVNVDSSSYGQWLDASTFTNPDPINITIEGEVSLCKAYLPAYNIQDGSSTEYDIEIPRVDSGTTTGSDPSSGYLALRFPANATTWRNLAHVTAGDQVRVLVEAPVTSSSSTSVSNVTMYDAIAGGTSSAKDCSSSIVSNVDAICGRAAINGASFVSKCEKYVWCETVMKCKYKKGGCSETVWDDCMESVDCETKLQSGYDSSTVSPCGYIGGNCNTDGCHKDRGDRYKYNPSTTLPSFTTDNIFLYDDHTISDGIAPSATAGDFMLDTNIDCNKLAISKGYIQKDGDPTNVDYKAGASYGHEKGVPVPTTFEVPRPEEYYAWMIEGDGILMKYGSTSSAPSSVSATDTSASVLRISGYPAINGTTLNSPGKILLSTLINSGEVPYGPGSMLQLSYIQKEGSVDPSKNTGGYVLYLQQTKCRRSQGLYFTDTYTDRGRILYYILPSEYDMNNLPTDSDFSLSNYQNGTLQFDGEGKAMIQVNAAQQIEATSQVLWLKIVNDPNDYKNSAGEYEINFRTDVQVGNFSTEVLQPLIRIIDEHIAKLGSKIFADLVCFKYEDTGKCFFLFSFIKAVLTIYVMVFSTLFLMGRIQFSVQVVLTHILKIIVVGGLTDNRTFQFFNDYIYKLLFSFVDGIMGNFGGYGDPNPFAYADELFSRVILNPLAYIQVLAILSFGLSGVMNLIVIILGIILFMISNIFAITAYLLSKIILSFLISLAPIFLIFCLFKTTSRYFQIYINQIFKNLLEPVIICMGMACFTKIFVVFLDRVLSFSVCYKCTIPIKLSTILGNFFPAIPTEYMEVDIFCLYWFAPWGMDSKMGLMTLSFPEMLGMALLGYLAFTYTGFASTIASALTDAKGFQAGADASKISQDSVVQASKAGAKALAKEAPNAAKFAGNVGIEVSKFVGRRLGFDEDGKNSDKSKNE